jgi:hypothetical protein
LNYDFIQEKNLAFALMFLLFPWSIFLFNNCLI